MSIEQLQKIVGMITYKPGYEFRVKYSDQGLIKIQVQSYQLDATGKVKDKSVPFIATQSIQISTLRPEKIEQQMIQFTFETIRMMELHELDEWFKVSGLCYRDPHPELKKKAA